MFRPTTREGVGKMLRSQSCKGHQAHDQHKEEAIQGSSANREGHPHYRWPNNDGSSKSSGPSFLTLFTSGEAGRTTRTSSGIRTRRRLRERGSGSREFIQSAVAGLVENNRHAVVNRLKQSIGGRSHNGERRLPLTGPELLLAVGNGLGAGMILGSPGFVMLPVTRDR
jgi:hypothetical protein